MNKSVLFDMDGVILDSMPYHVKAWQKALSEYGFSVSAELLYLHEGAIEPDTAAAIFKDNGHIMNADIFKKILSRQMEIFSSLYQTMIKPFPGVPQILKRLRHLGWQMALVTSSHQKILQRVLPPEIKNYMDYIITGDQVKRRKPFPDPFIAALSLLGGNQKVCLVVENAPAGIKAAKAADLHCIALTTTLSKEHLFEADTVFNSHEEVINYMLTY
jgi:beta-phosphoglucomutase